MGEFDLIARHFDRRSGSPASWVPLGIGDDCALLAPARGTLAVSTDMLVAGRHFFEDVPPAALGHKALAVNLSDLAAMGAAPRAFTLALALPDVDDAWLTGFAEGMFALADAHGIVLAGGDTTRGPLNLCITVFGDVPPGQALRRDRARAGDDLWVSGDIGAAAFAVRRRMDGRPLPFDHPATERLERPRPRVALGLALRGIAHAAIDLSDGLTGDLAHVLKRSGLGATIDVDRLPFHACLAGIPSEERLACALAGGDDYELAFTAPASARRAIEDAAAGAAVPVTRVGCLEATSGLRLRSADGFLSLDAYRAWDHFDRR